VEAVTLNKVTEEGLIIEGILIVDDKLYTFTSTETYYSSKSLLDRQGIPKSMYVVEKVNDTFVEFNALTRIIKFKIPLKIRKIRHNVFNIEASEASHLSHLKLIDEHTNIRKELSLDVKRIPSSHILMCDFKVKDCLRLETLEEGKTYNVNVISSKSFRDKKRYLIVMRVSSHDDREASVKLPTYVSNSSFEEEFEGAGMLIGTALVMQTLKIRRNNSGHREMFVKLVTF